MRRQQQRCVALGEFSGRHCENFSNLIGHGLRGGLGVTRKPAVTVVTIRQIAVPSSISRPHLPCIDAVPEARFAAKFLGRGTHTTWFWGCRRVLTLQGKPECQKAAALAAPISQTNPDNSVTFHDTFDNLERIHILDAYSIGGAALGERLTLRTNLYGVVGGDQRDLLPATHE